MTIYGELAEKGAKALGSTLAWMFGIIVVLALALVSAVVYIIVR